ncbi:cytochrome biogenesis protein [Bradyrhizobium sp. SSBR45G]|uniref:sulfite exporter TauE/SafE family protein n=1 Tax=unclassified Bradyrhizobium TaxID=2631580 RepID=UPI0023429A00|nr:MULTISPECIES: sulfite exporter TauE/SafE family protein [unclassified Bradyrhizobium]GLH79778.1 cytochrome biogenesis protein [Bradyrhizobium sp. SSBR45G]GLH87104.1 cytochrome biogenesis protein [Bradyrhizobium sp. SSBR45R]
MFDFDQPLFIAGLLLGFSSSLHCFGMCSGIASGLHFAAELGPARSRQDLWSTALLINGGRIAAYMLAGATVGALGSSVFGAFDQAIGHAILRWAAAAALAWIGLSMLDLVPMPTGLYRLASVVSSTMTRAAHATNLPPRLGILVSGVIWGFLPCAMVYAALFYAMLSGSWLGGALAMSGFGVGTLPALLAAGLGLPILRRRATSTWLRNTVGLAIITVGVVSAVIPPSTLAAWCRS